MNKSLPLVCCALLAICLGCFSFVETSSAVQSGSSVVSTGVSPVNPTLQLQQAVHRLNAWLVSSKDSQVWRRNLLLNLLDTQSALGERADLATLSQIESRFSQPNEGLDKPVFRDVQAALKSQIKQLSEMHLRGLANQQDLSFAVIAARGQYRPITIATLDQQRNRAVSDLESLKKYYRKTMRSRKRANLFYDMQLDQTIEFLEGMEFELPPEISVGKIDSMISSVKKQLQTIEEEIDAIPETPQPDDEEEDGPEEDKDEEDSGEEDNPEQGGDIEPAISVYEFGFGPVPDDGEPDLDDLKREKKKVEAQLETLSDQRSGVLKTDRPRRQKRSREFNQLREFEANFTKVSKTQTDPYFIAVQTSLEQFVRAYFYGSDDNLQEEYLVKLQDLEENLLKMRGPEAREASAQLGASVSWLEDANQVSPLVAAIRAKYSLPNFYLAISGKLISQLGSQTLTQTDPVRQSFKGRLIRGNSRVDGRVDLVLRDDPNQVHLDIGLRGSIAASTYAQQGKLQVFTNTSGCFSADRSLFANIGGLLASEPKINVSVDSKLGGTTSRLKLVNRIAAKQFAEAKPEAEKQTESQARDQLGSQFAEQTDGAISGGNSALSRAQGALVSNARLAPEVYLRSTNSQVVLIGKKSSPSALAAPSYPARSNVPTDVAVRIHESVLSNLFERALSGKKFTNEQLAEQIGGVFGGKAPKALTAAAGEEDEEDDEDEDKEDESFSITFSTIRPIQFEFENNALGVAISGRRFSQGDKKINAGLKIGLRFKIKRIDGKLKLVRDGKAELDYVGEKKNARVIAFRSFLDGKLNPKEGDQQQISIDLPDNLLPIDQLDSLKDNELARGMTLVQCRSEGGWIYLGWNHTPKHFAVQHLVDFPAIWNEAIVSTMNDVYIDSSSLPESPTTSPVEVVEPPQPDDSVKASGGTPNVSPTETTSVLPQYPTLVVPVSVGQ